MKPLRAAVFGVGYLGQYHAEKYAAMADVELVGVADLDPDRARTVAGRLGTRAVTDYRELLPRVDAVSIAVHTPAHFEVGKECLIRGVDVLIEKPMTTDLAQADILIDLAERNGRIIQVGHLERFNPAVMALRDIVTDPMFIESHRLAVFKPRCTDVSVVLDLMIHDIDIILNLVNAEVADIRAAGIPVASGLVDIANARLEFVNGCVANVTASRISMKNERKIRLFQPDAYISVDFANHTIATVRKDPGKGDTNLIPGMAIDERCFTKGDALDDEIRAFVHSVRHRKAPEVTGQKGRAALAVALDIMTQIEKTSRRYRP